MRPSLAHGSAVRVAAQRWTDANGQTDASPAFAASVVPPPMPDLGPAPAPSPRGGDASAVPAGQAPAPASPVINELDLRIEPTFREQLAAVTAAPGPARLLFPVSDGRTLDLLITRHEAQDARQGVVYAEVDDHPAARAVLAYVDEAVAGTIMTGNGELFQVRYAGNGVHRVLQLDPNHNVDSDDAVIPPASLGAAAAASPGSSLVAPEQAAGQVAADVVGADVVGNMAAGNDAVLPSPSGPEIAADMPPVAADATDTQVKDGTSTVIAVLAAYTAQSRANNGGTAGMLALINASFATANLAYANSQANVILHVVNTVEVNYTNTSVPNYLGPLANASDGNMDEVFALRTQYNADLVTLFVTPGADGVAGVAYLLNGEAQGAAVYPSAFSVVGDVYADSYFTLAHEIGHNLGCGHGNAEGGGIFASSNGYRFVASGQTYRTVMAYAPGTRIGYFSNPSLTFLGVTLGNSNANNAATINRTRSGMASPRSGAPDWTVSAQGDLNADTLPDLVWRNLRSGRVIAWLLNGVTSTSRPELWPATNPADAAWVPMVTADLNADTQPDTVWRNTSTGRVIVWYMNGTTRVTPGVIWAPVNPGDASWIPMAAGHFNLDNKPDLVWWNKDTGRVIVWYMDGITRIGTGTLWSPATPADTAWVPFAAGEFNGDGKVDMLWRNMSTGRVIIWYLDGVTRTGTFALWPATNPGEPAWRPMATGDFNGDGQIDIVWRNTDTGRVIVWYMNGSTRVGTAVIWG